MVATAPTKSVPTTAAARAALAPDLAHFRRRYPETVANFGALPEREAWLRRIWELETAWHTDWETRGGAYAEEEAILFGPPPAGREAEGEFDVVYAGGAAALLHAAALACGHERRVLVIGGARAEGEPGGVWNLSEDELKELEGASVFTREEVEAAVLNRYRGGFVKFHDAASRVKAEPLWVTGALDVAVRAVVVVDPDRGTNRVTVLPRLTTLSASGSWSTTCPAKRTAIASPSFWSTSSPRLIAAPPGHHESPRRRQAAYLL